MLFSVYIYVMQRKDALTDGEFYHLYNRGNSKQAIFLDDEDRDRFIKLLYLCNSERSVNFRDDIVNMKIDAFDFDRGKPLVSIGAWTLMPNHFHLLVTAKSSSKQNIGKEGSNISIFMKKLLTSYSKYFNKKHERTGALFEGAFKNKRLSTDPYLKYIFSYIHLNPAKLVDSKWKEKEIKEVDKIKNHVEKYSWSSYRDYLGQKRVQNSVLNKKDFPKYFDTSKAVKVEMFDWLTFQEE